METKSYITDAISDEDISGIDILESLFFAYRDFISDPDKILEELDLGRAHHRVLYFVNRHPGLTVAELLETLQITKQSLARVLKQLIEAGHLAQIEGANDRRKRHLYPTRLGREFILKLSVPQSKRIQSAISDLQEPEKDAVRKFLIKMADSSL